MSHTSVLTLACLSVGVVGSFAWTQSTSPSTTATNPASEVPVPATEPAKAIELSGYIAPLDPQKIELKPKSFTNSVTVTQVVKHGEPVKAGQTLITFDLAELDKAILEATSAVEVAKAGLAKSESDATLGEKADAATLEEKTDALADAQANFAWWRDIEGPDFLRKLDEAIQAGQDSIDDQEDELDQLRKMYKSEELTNATADIVVKRAVRQLQRSKQALELAKHATDKQKTVDYVNQKQAIDRALEAAERSLAEAKATLAQSSVTRAASLLKARGDLKDAQKKLGELEEDKLKLSDIKAKIDGIAYYGAFDHGAWQGAKDDAIKVGEKSDTAKTLMTIVAPAKLCVVAKVDEAKFFDVHEGATARVTPAALPETRIAGKLAQREVLPEADGSFEQQLDLQSVDARLVPGMKVKIEVSEAAK